MATSSTGIIFEIAPRAFAFAAFRASSSSRVKSVLSGALNGRSSGTSELKFHTPRKSGWPDSVRGALY